MLSLRYPFAIATSAALLNISGGVAQRVDPAKLIDLHVNAEQQNVSFSGTIPEGGKFRLTIVATQQMYAISAVQVQRTVFDVTVLRGQVSGKDTTYTPVERVLATVGRPAPLHSLRYFTVIIEGTRRADSPLSVSPTVRPVLASFSREFAGFEDFCCLSCGGIIACGCRVDGTCGHCCVGNCCPKSLPEALLPAPDTRPLSRLGQRPCKPVPDAERVYGQFRPATGRVAIRT